MTLYNHQTIMSKTVEGRDGGGVHLLQYKWIIFSSFVFIGEILKKYSKSLFLVFCLTACENNSGAHLIIWFQNRLILVTLQPESEKWWVRERQLLKISRLFLFIRHVKNIKWALKSVLLVFSFTGYERRTGALMKIRFWSSQYYIGKEGWSLFGAKINLALWLVIEIGH